MVMDIPELGLNILVLPEYIHSLNEYMIYSPLFQSLTKY